MKKFLHVGCGSQSKDNTTEVFNSSEWNEVRLDIDESVKPDIVASMQDMHMIKDGEYDGLYSSHNIEHLYPHEVEGTLKEFFRVLSDDGEMFITCPDLMVIAKEIIEGRFAKTLYESPAGPIAPIDMLFGHRSSVAAGNTHMAHRCAFTIDLLGGLIRNCGFNSVIGALINTNIYVIALKKEKLEEEAGQRLKAHLGDT
tara:strand:+ start:851 stop:1447 length:597 start_codon:yes stop_codon:yes gene_type:complete